MKAVLNQQSVKEAFAEVRVKMRVVLTVFVMWKIVKQSALVYLDLNKETVDVCVNPEIVQVTVTVMVVCASVISAKLSAEIQKIVLMVNGV
jgi:hypothetical protein